jgi:hypothetical protein
LIPALLAMVLPMASPASAAPACVMINWRSGQSCTFEPVAGAFLYGGVATAAEGQNAWIAVEVVFQGVVIDSCYGSGFEVATCSDYGQAFVGNLTHVCRVWGTGGPKAHCADPPALPVGR